MREVKLLCVWLFLSFSPWRALPNLAKKAKRARERWTESEGRGREKESERERERDGGRDGERRGESTVTINREENCLLKQKAVQGGVE